MNAREYDAYVSEEPPLFADLRHLFDPARVRIVLDIGACEGEDSVRYARLFPAARVLAFEPLPSNQQLARAHFARLGADRCELVPLALSDASGTAELHVSSGAPEEKVHGAEWDYGNKSSSLLPPGLVGRTWLPWLKFEKKVTVTTRTLDDYARERAFDGIDFVHLDVQGAEWLVLQGASGTLPRVKCLWIEVADAEIYRGQKQRPEIDAFLRRRGFRALRQNRHDLESDLLYVNLRWPAGLRAWLALGLRTLPGRARFRLGAWRRRIFGSR
jgi:FkbM family methyltransferase